MDNGTPGHPAPTVTRAVCASISKFDGSAMQELLAVRNELCGPGRNARTRIVLLYTSRWLVLWVEGDDDDVDRVLRIAASDRRVAHQKLLHRSRGPSVLPDRVAVSATQSPLRPADYAQIVARMAERGPQLDPVEMFRVLAAPCVIGGPGATGGRPSRHVALLSSEDNGPIDQLRKLGERFCSPVIYRRFGAGRRHTTDVGISYLDVPLADGIGRIHLLSRAALEQPMVRHGMSQLDALALFLGTHAASAADVASTLAQCLQSRTPQLRIHVCGAADEVARHCARLLAERGVGRVEQAARGADRDLAAWLPEFGWRPLARDERLCTA
jgi:hypothetical protein